MNEPAPMEADRSLVGETADAVRQEPKVWLLMGHKAGDNNQVLALAEALGWPFEIKQFVYHRYELLSNRLLGATLAGVVKRDSSPLHPPWPDLIITAGRRNEPIARWIRLQAGGAVRLVHLGRPWSALERFDLIVTTPQYRLPERSNILHNLLPLHRINSARLDAAARQWAPRLARLPRPWLAVLLGGDSGPFVFTVEKGQRLGAEANRRVRAMGGALLVSDSARTPEQAFDAFYAELDVPVFVHRWRSATGENPYFGYLALADEILVTGESMSMLTEACATRKPLLIFDLADSRRSGEGERGQPRLDLPTRDCRRWRSWRHNLRFKPITHWLAMRFGPERMKRDVSAIQRELVAAGRAVWSDRPLPNGPVVPPLQDLERAVERVRGLFRD